MFQFGAHLSIRRTRDADNPASLVFALLAQWTAIIPRTADRLASHASHIVHLSLSKGVRTDPPLVAIVISNIAFRPHQVTVV